MECVKAQCLSLAPIPEGQLLLVKLQILSVTIDLVVGFNIYLSQSLKLMILCESVGFGEETIISHSKMCPWLSVSETIETGKANRT